MRSTRYLPRCIYGFLCYRQLQQAWLQQFLSRLLWYIAGSATAPEHCRVRAAEKLAGNDIEDAFFRRKITSAMKELVLKNQKSNIA